MSEKMRQEMMKDPKWAHVRVGHGTQEQADALGILIHSDNRQMASKTDTPEEGSRSERGWTNEQFLDGESAMRTPISSLPATEKKNEVKPDDPGNPPPGHEEPMTTVTWAVKDEAGQVLEIRTKRVPGNVADKLFRPIDKGMEDLEKPTSTLFIEEKNESGKTVRIRQTRITKILTGKSQELGDDVKKTE